MELYVFQKIIETTNSNNQITHTLENGNLIVGFEIDILDEEIDGPQKSEDIINEILRNIPEGVLLKVYLKSEFTNADEKEHSRSKALKSVGFIKNRAYLIFEKPVQISLKKLFGGDKSKQTFGSYNLLNHSGINYRPLEKSDIYDFLPKVREEISHSFQTIDLGEECVSVMRLLKQTPYSLDLKTLSHLKDSLPLPYIICCSVQKVSEASAETLLRRRSKQNSIGDDFKENRKLEEAQSDLEDISLNGSQLFKFEWQCLLPRSSEDILRFDREEAKRRLSPLGDIFIESVGAFESLKSFYPGSSPHFTLLEKDSVLSCYIPVVSRADSESKKRVLNRSLALHRRDESLTFLDIFDPTYESYSWCIFGRPGTGKSVITNAITRSLLCDESVKIIKIDVGGSHSRETESLGGVEKTLLLNEPTGINPFDILKELGPSKEAIQVLAGFLEVLILEENESKLSKVIKSELENVIYKYSKNYVGIPCLEDFFNKSLEIPRRNLLQRWVGNGVYGNAFAVPTAKSTEVLDSTAGGALFSPSPEGSRPFAGERLTYYNFSKISQALDPDYAQGGLAAVMVQFNLEMLRPTADKKRLVFIADETPFFIKKCFSFFNLSIANVRKEGHGFITVAQMSSHVVIDNDTGILDNSPNKIYFSMDGEESDFISKNQVDKETVDKIKSLNRVQGEYSEALFKDTHGEKVVKIRLSSEEYWSYTSKDEDRRKFYELKKACPSLSLQEIVRCLSI